jgi:hypothetical protein
MDGRGRERGFALAGAVFALVIIASLIAGAFFAARQEMSIGRSSTTYTRAFGAAEAGMAAGVAQWNTGTFNALAVGGSTTLNGSVPNNGGTYALTVSRLNDELFLLRSVGTDPTGGSQRQLASLTRLQRIAMDFNASLTTRGSLKIGGSSFIDGVDENPSSWSCPGGALDTLSGILTRDSTQISTSGCGGYSCIRGDPKIEQDPTINDSTFFVFGDLDWAELVAMATKTYIGNTGPLNSIAPSLSGGICNTANTNNWGEPWRGAGTVAPCYGYFPIIYVNGNLKLTGGRGQGILLVEGDLEVQGGFEFYGPVIVRQQLITQGTGGHFNGGVMAANVSLDQSTVLGDAIITYSSCAITAALNGNASGRLLASRSWADLTQ